MGYKSLLAQQVHTAMRTLGQADGLAPVQTYVSVGTSYTDVDTGDVVRSETTYSVPMALVRFTVDEVDGTNIQTTDLKAIFAATDLPVAPKLQDRINLSDGREFSVERQMGVPGIVNILMIRYQSG